MHGQISSAVIYSLIETAKENGLKPYNYLTHIFRAAPNLDLHDTEQLDALLPDYFKTGAGG